MPVPASCALANSTQVRRVVGRLGGITTSNTGVLSTECGCLPEEPEDPQDEPEMCQFQAACKDHASFSSGDCKVFMRQLSIRSGDEVDKEV